MAFVDFDLFRAHVRADDFEGDEAVLRHYLAAAEESVLRAVNRPLEELAEMNAGEVPRGIVQAVLMTGAYYYDPREAAGIAMTEVPMGASALISQWRRLS